MNEISTQQKTLNKMQIFTQSAKNNQEAIICSSYEEMRDAINQLVRNYKSTQSFLKSLLDLQNYSEDTYTHSYRVANLSINLGRALKLQEEDLINLGIASLLHDIGKLFIPDEILNKPSALEGEEIYKIQKHPVYGYLLARNYHKLPFCIISGILYHHENYDGSGYPFGVTIKGIPLFARIIHVTDVFEALTAPRCYHRPLEAVEALDYLLQNKNIMFDSKVVDVFKEYCIPIIK